MTGAATTRRTRRKPAAANGAMTEAVDQMLASVGPLNAERTVLAELARTLARTLDGMRPTVAARMSGQTSGQLLKVLDKLGAGAEDVLRIPGRPQTVTDFTAADFTAATPTPDEVWYPGIEDDLWAEKLAWIIKKYARRRGLPVPGSPSYSRAPWAPSPYDYVVEQREKREVKPFRPLAILEHGYADLSPRDGPADNVVALPV